MKHYIETATGIYAGSYADDFVMNDALYSEVTSPATSGEQTWIGGAWVSAGSPTPENATHPTRWYFNFPTLAAAQASAEYPCFINIVSGTDKGLYIYFEGENGPVTEKINKKEV